MAEPPGRRRRDGALACLSSRWWWRGAFLLGLSGACGEVAPNRPFQVVRPTNDHGSMVPVVEGLQALAQHDAKIALVSVVGPYHSGKSFLLNALAGQTNVFAIGRMTSPETMGIWLCRTDMRASDGAEVWLMDSEGFFGPGVSESYDAKIFTIASLLGGHLVYNTVKIIDQQAVTLLEMLARRAQLFRTRSSAEPNSAEAPEFLSVRSFPPLTWVVEDFVQELPEQHRLREDGATAWLRSYLSKVNQSDIVNEHGYSEDQHFLARLYKDLKVQTLFLPATSKEQLTDLSKVTWDQLTPEFQHELSDLKAHILSHLEARKFEGKSMRGPTLERCLRFIVQALQRGMFHELPSLWATWTSQVAEMSLQDAESWFASLLQGVDVTEDPVPVSVFNAEVEARRERAHEFYRELLRDFDVRPNFRKLADKIDHHFQHKLVQYHERIQRWVQDLVHRAKDTFANAMERVELPMDPAALKQLGEKDSKVLRQEFASHLQAFSRAGSPVTLGKPAQMPAFSQDPVSQLTIELRSLQEQRDLQNDRVIMQAFKGAVAAADEAVEAELKAHSGRLMGKAQLKDLQSSALSKCHQTFDESLAMHRWMTQLPHYKTHKAQARTESYDSKIGRFIATNDQRLSMHFNTAVERCVTYYRARKANLAMPVAESDLETEHRALEGSVRDLLDEQAGHGGELKDTEAYRGAVRMLAEVVEEGARHARQKNIELWKVHSDEATRCALRENEIVRRQCGWQCFFNKVPGVHRSTCMRHLMQCFGRSGAGSKMSPQMQMLVFESWYLKDLAAEASAVRTFFYTSIVTLVVGAVLFCAFWQRPPSQPSSAFQQNWPPRYGRPM
mmetsp:Transcript_114630/g.331255  ORF Transcript_114630/g.331255 Transcript_114630/m.331255 type:complete len:842 (-) Transcript_114630:153-2678(-)